MSGYVRIHRTLIGHPAFRNDAEAMAFAWLVAKAQWRATRVRYKERGIYLERGQLAISQRDMARDLDRDKAWVERLWKRLRGEAMIEVDSEAGVAVITICNYSQYQSDAPESEAVAEAPRKADARQTQGTEQRREKGKKENNRRVVSIQAPEWMPVEPWLAFVAMRERMASGGKILWSADAAKGVISKIDRLRGEGHCPAKLLEKAVVSSWRTVFEGDDTKATRVAVKQSPEEIVAFYERMGMHDDAKEARRKYGLSVGKLATDIVKQVRVAQ